MVFDALIGEQDRHEENWGLLKANNKYRLSPLYDSSCNLLREFKDEIFASRIYNGTIDFNKFITRSKTCIFKENSNKLYKHFELIEYLYEQYPEIVTKELKNLKRLNRDMLQTILNKLPENIITQKHKEFILEYVLKRKYILLNFLKKEGEN